MASSSKKSANLLGKRKPEDCFETKPILKRLKQQSEDKEPAVRKKTLFVDHLPYGTKISDIISDIIDFFKDVGEVVHVRLIVNHRGDHRCCGFVEFASANEAKKALQKKNGEYLHDRKISLDVAMTAPYPPKYCIDHKVCCEDYLLIEDDLETKPNLFGFCGKKITFSDDDYLPQESLPIEQDESPPDFAEEVLFVANLSPQTEILHIINFFNYVGEVVSVRLIVNHEGKHVGYGFVEFACAKEAKKALEKNGEYLHDHKVFLDVAKTAPNPPKYNLAEKLCYEDYLRRGLDETPNFAKGVAVRKKTLFVDHLPYGTKISDIISNIINFFKDVGEVVHVRLIVNDEGDHVGCGFVEFASSNEAKKALEKKNGKYLHDRMIVLKVAKIAPPPKYCIDHKVWYEDYLRQENLLIEEDEEVEGLDEIPDFVEEVAVRKKTLFVDHLPYVTKISAIIPNIIDIFKDVGEVVHVRLIVNHKGNHVGCGFVEFASANEAKKALQKKNGAKLRGYKIFLDLAKTAPYPLRPKYNLAEKLCSRYEDYLRRESRLIEDDLETKPNIFEFCSKKITFSDND